MTLVDEHGEGWLGEDGSIQIARDENDGIGVCVVVVIAICHWRVGDIDTIPACLIG